MMSHIMRSVRLIRNKERGLLYPQVCGRRGSPGAQGDLRKLLKSGFWFLAVGGFVLCGLRGSALCAAQLRAGAALVDITPAKLPIRTAGNLTLTVVSNIHDSLHARALVLDD